MKEYLENRIEELNKENPMVGSIWYIVKHELIEELEKALKYLNDNNN